MKRTTLSKGFAMAGVFLFFQSSNSAAEMIDQVFKGMVDNVESGVITVYRPGPSLYKAGIKETQVAVNEDTRLKDIDSVTELKKGDEVHIEYKEEKGKVVAIEVVKVEERQFPHIYSRYKAW